MPVSGSATLELITAVWNNLCYNLSFCVLLRAFNKAKLRYYMLFFCLVTAAGILLNQYNTYFTIPIVLIASAVFYLPGRNLPRSFFQALTVTFLLTVLIFLSSSVVYLLFPGFSAQDGFSFYMGGSLLLLSGILCIVIKGNRLTLSHSKTLAFWAALELLTILFISFVLPSVRTSTLRHFGLFNILFLLFMGLAYSLFYYVGQLEKQHLRLTLEKEHERAFMEQAQKQYETVIYLRHFYNKLYEGLRPFIRDNDMQGLTAFFETHIAPVHTEYIGVHTSVSNIKNDLIRNLLETTVTHIRTELPHVELSLSLDPAADIPDGQAFALYKACSVLLDNALQYLSKRPSGELSITIHRIARCLTVQIANTVDSDFTISALNDTKPKKEHGHGLGILRRLVLEHPEFELDTYVDENGRGKRLAQVIRIFP